MAYGCTRKGLGREIPACLGLKRVDLLTGDGKELKMGEMISSGFEHG